MTKKNIFILSAIVTIFLVFLIGADSAGYCNRGTFCFSVSDYLEPPIGSILVIFPFVFLFSLITYKMRNEVFEHWMKFAKWAIPAVMVISFFIGTIPRGSGLMSGMVEAFFYLLALGIFCIVSLWRIAKKYIELKKR